MATHLIPVTWLGHSTFLFQSPEGKVILIDPWVKNNPATPQNSKKLSRVDLMLITHGHGDHIGDAVEVGRAHDPKVVAIYETCMWLESKGVRNCLAMNKGGSQTIEGIKITMVNAIHSCGIEDNGKFIYGGEACGYVFTFSNRRIFYHAGDTNVFGDMALIRHLYKPDVAFLPIGDLYTMSPKEAAYACKLLESPKVVPMHYGTFPELTGTPGQLKELLLGTPYQVVELKPGETKEI